MNARITVATLALLTLAATVVAGRPASVPSTGPALAGDAGPVSALAEYNRAMMALDEKGMLARLDARGDAEKRVAAAMVRADLAVARLVRGAVAKFGEGALAPTAEAIGDVREEDIGGARAEAEGTHVLVDKRGRDVSEAVRVEGVWKLRVSAGDGGEDDVRESLDASVRTQSRCKVLLQDVEAGKFESLEKFLKAAAAAFEEG